MINIEDLFGEEEFSNSTKNKNKNKAPGADSLVNEFLKYGGSEVRNKLLKIMNMILLKRKYLTILGKLY